MEWYAAKCIFKHHPDSTNALKALYEERVVLFQARISMMPSIKQRPKQPSIVQTRGDVHMSDMWISITSLKITWDTA